MVDDNSIHSAIHDNNNTGEAVIKLSAPKDKRVSVCMGCGQEIYDQFILRVSPDLEWHAACLKCTDCNQYLDESCTCFVRDGKTYCKADYIKLFGAKCSKCDEKFNKNDYVMRARHKIFHIQCFHCVACAIPLRPGDEFALRDDGLYCKNDHDLLDHSNHSAALQPMQQTNSLDSNSLEILGSANPLSPLGSLPVSTTGMLGSLGSGVSRPPRTRSVSSDSESRVCSKEGGGGGKGKKDKPKTTRVRTVLNEKQLHTLRTCYNANPRPDALMKEQLVEMTGLSPRVIRVWFQNKRCKDKKRQIAMKQMQQLQEKNQALNGVRMQGVGPLITASPTRHEPLTIMSPIEVQQFQQNPAIWAPLRPDAQMESQTPFQQLIHGFGDPSDPSVSAYLNQESAGGHFPGSSIESEMDSFSPQMAASDLSSPSCSD